MRLQVGHQAGRQYNANRFVLKMLLLADASVDDDIIYEMVKVFWENLDDLETTHSIVKQMDVEEAVTELAGIPLHEGAKKYYEEMGLLK